MDFKSTMVKELRLKMGLTQEQMAQEVCVGSRTIARWESGKLAKIQAAVRNNLIEMYKKHMEA
jgi:transcriptional regulator with XRE-family HTH domain